MIGFDFHVFWETGQAVLSGGNPYAVAGAQYPPVTSLVFALFALLPFLPSFAVWTGNNIVFCLATFRQMNLRRPAWAWLLFTPIVFNLMAGENDLPFMWLAVLLPLGEWKAVAAAVFITMKPQLALVVLPWFLLRWLKSDRRLVLWWLAGTLVFQLLPLLYSPSIFQDWLAAIQGGTASRSVFSSGIFSLVTYGVPAWLAGILAAAIAVWGLFQDEMTSRTAQLVAMPVTIWYDDALLTGSVPAYLLIPYSLVAFVASYLLTSALPLATIPLAVLAYRLVMRRQKQLALARS